MKDGHKKEGGERHKENKDKAKEKHAHNRDPPPQELRDPPRKAAACDRALGK
jgi:hypothetical protein